MQRYQRNWFQTPVTTKDRFNALDKPSAQSFANLFASLPFVLEAGDTASTTQQGLARTGTDMEVYVKTIPSGWTDGMTRFVQPYQLPDVIGADATITVTKVIWDITASVVVPNMNDPSHLYRIMYQLSASPSVIHQVLFNNTTTVNIQTTGGLVDFAGQTLSLPANTLKNVGDTLRIKVRYSVPTTAGQTAQIILQGLQITPLYSIATAGSGADILNRYIEGYIDVIVTSTTTLDIISSYVLGCVPPAGTMTINGNPVTQYTTSGDSAKSYSLQKFTITVPDITANALLLESQGNATTPGSTNLINQDFLQVQLIKT